MFGFARQRKALLDAELQRIVAEFSTLGIQRAMLTGDFAEGRVGPETGLEILVIQQTDRPFHRRPDFFTSHVIPRVAVRWWVYAPEEFEEFASEDPVIRQAMRIGEELYAA